MAICMKIGERAHDHNAACDVSRVDGHGDRTVVAISLKDDVALQVRTLMERSPIGYTSVSDFFNHLLQTQALRKRGTQLRGAK